MAATVLYKDKTANMAVAQLNTDMKATMYAKLDDGDSVV